MKIFKPLDLSLLYKVFEWDNEQQFVATSILGFNLETGESILEPDLWKLLGKALGKDVALDHCMPKLNGEVLLYGSYYSPDKVSVTAGSVTFKVGGLQKTLNVVGNRFWRPLIGPTPPESFETMSFGFENAFGGANYELNPLGKGMDEITLESGEKVVPLPNIEHPDKLLTSESQRPDPESFSPIDISWQQRTKKMGTYDEKWIKEKAPAYPDDMDWTHFNTAPQNQWIDNYFSGGEDYELVNMHPEKPSIKGQLPDYRVRCFLEKVNSDSDELLEIKMRIDTVYFIPEVDIGILVYRGTQKIEKDDATDIENLLLAYESNQETSRSEQHYYQALKNRLDPDKKIAFMMSTTDLIPASVQCGFARLIANTDSPAQAMRENLEQKKIEMMDEVKQELEEKKKELANALEGAGVDSKQYMDQLNANNNSEIDADLQKCLDIANKIIPGSQEKGFDVNQPIDLSLVDLSKMDDLKKQMLQMADNQQKEVKLVIKEQIDILNKTDGNIELIEKLEKSLVAIDLPPVLPRDHIDEAIQQTKDNFTELKKMQGLLIKNGSNADNLSKIINDFDIDGFEKKMREKQQDVRKTYCMSAHMIDEGIPPHHENMSQTQEIFEARLHAKENLSYGDYAGLKMSGFDLSGKDLSWSCMEGVDLSNADLSNANLEGAVMVNANLTGTNFSESNLKSANLGNSNLQNATFMRCDMSDATLSKSDLSNTVITDCNLSGVNLLEAHGEKTDFSRSNLSKIYCIEQEFKNCNFSGTDLSGNSFVDCSLNGSDFSNSKLIETNFVNCDIESAKFNDANLTNVRFVGGINLKNTSYVNACLDKANFRDADVSNSDFTNTSINMTDFGKANLQKTVFNKAVGLRPQFIEADLGLANLSNAGFFEGTMLKARLTSADLSKSNFYSVEFMSATVGETDFSDSILEMTKLKDWRPTR